MSMTRLKGDDGAVEGARDGSPNALDDKKFGGTSKGARKLQKLVSDGLSMRQ